jgi:MarR family transcriptional regulator, lower aerobic nicotinate degradation pathway regulator
VTTSPAQTAARDLLHVVMLVMRSLAADMRRSRLQLAPAQMGTLMKIATGPCTMSDLARHQAVSLPTVSRSVDMLVRRRWVERWIDKSDRRQTLVGLTARGRRVLADIKQRTERHVTQALAPLTPSERAGLIAALKPLNRVLTVPNERT